MAKFNLSKLTEKAKDFVDKNGDKIANSVDKVTDKVDQKTKGKYSDKLQKVDNLTAKLDKKNAANDEHADTDADGTDVAVTDPTPSPRMGAEGGPEGLISSPIVQEPASGPDDLGRPSFPEPS